MDKREMLQKEVGTPAPEEMRLGTHYIPFLLRCSLEYVLQKQTWGPRSV